MECFLNKNQDLPYPYQLLSDSTVICDIDRVGDLLLQDIEVLRYVGITHKENYLWVITETVDLLYDENNTEEIIGFNTTFKEYRKNSFLEIERIINEIRYFFSKEIHSSDKKNLFIHHCNEFLVSFQKFQKSYLENIKKKEQEKKIISLY